MPLKYVDGPYFQIGTLNTTMDASTTSVVLSSGHGARFPSTGLYWVRIGNEVMKVSSRSTDTLTVVRGQDGTTAEAHDAGLSVDWVLGVSALEQFKSDTRDLQMRIGLGDDPLVVGSDLTPWHYEVACASDEQVRVVEFLSRVKIAPVGADLIVDVLRSTNGGSSWATLFTTGNSNKIVIADGTKSAVDSALAIDVLNRGDIIKVDVLQLGSTTPGSGFSSVCRMKIEKA